MLTVALVEAYWKQFWKVRQSTSWKTTTAVNLQSTKHSSKGTVTPFFWRGGGGTVPDVETNNLSSNFSLRGTMSTGMTVSDKAVVFWKISEIHLEESKLTPRPTMHGGRRSSWRRRFYFLWRFVMGEKVNQDSSAGQCDVPQTNRTTNFSLTGLTLWEKLCQAAVLGINSVCLLCSAS